MKAFAALYYRLSNHTTSDEKRILITQFLEQSSSEENMWAVHFLRNGPFKRLFSTKQLAELALLQVDFSSAIFEQCLDMTSDVMETISLMLPNDQDLTSDSFDTICFQAYTLIGKDAEEKEKFISNVWTTLHGDARYVFNKIVTNTFKSPVSLNTLTEALADFRKLDRLMISYQLFQNQSKVPIILSELHATVDKKILPFHFIENDTQDNLDELKDISEYHLSQEWNGVRVQLIRGQEACHIWTRRGEIVSDKFPELIEEIKKLPIDTVIDGVIICIQNEKLMPKSLVRKRMSRKRTTQKSINDLPICFCVIDLLKLNNKTLLALSFEKRHKQLEILMQDFMDSRFFQFSDRLTAVSSSDIQSLWAQIKPYRSQAIIFKSLQQSRKDVHLNWLKLSAPPHHATAVVLYVRRGEGALANEFVEFTMGARHHESYIPILKLPVRLSGDDHLEMKLFVRENLIERFGPVYSIPAKQVFEFSYATIEESGRRKSGIQFKKVQFVRWIKDGDAADITQLEAFHRQLDDFIE